MSFEHLLSPIKIGPFEMKNRIALAPMNETLSGVNGEVTEELCAYHAARAAGGTGMCTTGAIMGTEMASHFVWQRNVNCFHPGHIRGLAKLVDHMHYFGTIASAQMSIGFGRQGHSHDPNMAPPAATGGLPYEIATEKAWANFGKNMEKSERPRTWMYGQIPREMSIEEIRSEQLEFAKSCQMLVCAGFDCIEIHAPHGYLEHQFLSPLSNKRTDMYGGEWRNRKRFLNEVTEQIRYACPGVALGVRISAEEHMEGGLTAEEMVDLAQDLQARGIDFLSLSDGGGYEELGHLISDKDRAEHIPETSVKFKNALSIPIIVASQHDPVKANQDIGEGKYDISALGRQLFIDPDYANKLMSGKADEIRACKKCNMCIHRCLAQNGPGCPHNPELGREYTLEKYKIGPRPKGEALMPKGMTNAPLPALYDRPWWKPEIPILEKQWRPFRGPGPR